MNVEGSPSGGFGEYLKHQREARNFSLEEIAEQTKISLRALRALEAEDWEILPAEIYIRGFIRCYCETIGLDPNEALMRFEEAYEPFRRQRENLSAEKEYLPGQKKFPLFWVLLAVALLVLVGLGYYLFHVRGKPRPSEVILPSETMTVPEKGLSKPVPSENRSQEQSGSVSEKTSP